MESTQVVQPVVVGSGAASRRRSSRRRKLRESLYVYLLLSPALLVILVFQIIPLFWGFGYSLVSGGLLGGNSYVGFRNYAIAAENPIFLKTLKNTAEYAILTVPTVIVFALVVALILYQIPKVQGLFRGAFYFPLIVPVVVAANVWAYMVNRDFGPLNYVLGFVGIPNINWLGDPNLAIPAIVMLESWRGFGFYVIIFFAALQGIPRELYEAARIDGATGLRLAWSITVPLLRPALGFSFIMATIWNLQLFDPVYVLTSGGPAWSTSTVSWYVYQQAFVYHNIGLASAMAVVLLVVILVLSLGQLRFFRSDIEY